MELAVSIIYYHRGNKYPLGFGLPRLGFLFNMCNPRHAGLYFLEGRHVSTGLCTSHPRFFFLKHRQPNLCIFLKKVQRSVLFFYIRMGTHGPTFVSLLTILYIFKLFYMLLYIIVIVIIYLTDTYICKKTISHILLTYKNNFLTIKS